MMRLRPAAVAGLFYPDDPDALAATLARDLAVPVPEGEPLPQAVIVPHAGYLYSGPIAGVAYARVARMKGLVRRVVVVGPLHSACVDGIAVSGVDAFATPLGTVPIDAALRRRLLELPAGRVDDRAQAGEHSLEVQLPFLQATIGGFTLLPLGVGEAPPETVAEILDAVWGGPETLVVVSSDLSHYEDYATACAHDRRTAAAIVTRDADAIGDEDACGAPAVRGVLLTAQRRGLAVRLLALGNSGDTAGDRARVVGYGAFAVS